MPSAAWLNRMSANLYASLVVAAGAAGSSFHAEAANAPVNGPDVSLGAGGDFQQNEILHAVPSTGARRAGGYQQR